jgi:CheY-like chemotaxis protein
VLVADDNRVNRLLMARFLADQPIALDFACDGEEAVSMTLQLCPDLVFMDMSMPRMSGLDATRQILAKMARPPTIVALTANAFDSDRAACHEAGMTGFLTKPISRADLLAELARHAGPPELRRAAR